MHFGNKVRAHLSASCVPNIAIQVWNIARDESRKTLPKTAHAAKYFLKSKFSLSSRASISASPPMTTKCIACSQQSIAKKSTRGPDSSYNWCNSFRVASSFDPLSVVCVKTWKQWCSPGSSDFVVLSRRAKKKTHTHTQFNVISQNSKVASKQATSSSGMSA